MQLHKEIESDLIKRSSLAQTLIKKLYKEIQELKKTQADSTASYNASYNASPSRNQDSERAQVTSRESSEREQEETINKLKFELANLNNYKHYMENMQKVYSKKYETLGSLMADYLENLLYSRNAEEQAEENDVLLNINELRSKDIKEWKFEEMEAVIHLILAQLKPYLSVPLPPRRKAASSTSRKSRTSTSRSWRRRPRRPFRCRDWWRTTRRATTRRRRRGRTASRTSPSTSPPRSYAATSENGAARSSTATSQVPPLSFRKENQE